MTSSYDCDYIFKLITVGDSDAGKTSLMLQFIHKTFQPCTNTIGVEYGSKMVTIGDHTRVNLRVWDTAGQEVFRSITRLYYRGVAGVLLVYDITRRETFTHLPGWLEDVRQHVDSGMSILLVGNKTDLSRKRDVSIEEGEQFAKENGLLFMEASAKTAENVNEVFNSIGESILENIQNGRLNISNELSGIALGERREQGTRGQIYGPITQRKTGGCCS